MNEPLFDIPTPQKRMVWAWVLLLGLFALLIAGAVASSYIGADGTGPSLDQVQNERLLKEIVQMNEGMKAMGLSAQKQTDTLDEPLSQLAYEKEKNPKAATMYVVMRYEQGKKIVPKDLIALHRSKLKEHQALAMIYASEKLSEAEAKRLGGFLPQKGFQHKLARIHALEKAGVKDARRDVADSSTFLLLMVRNLGLLLAGFAGIGFWIAYLIARARGRARPLGGPAANLSLADADRFALRVLQIMGLYLVIDVVRALVTRSEPTMGSQVLIMTGFVVSIFFLFRVQVGGRRVSLGQIGISKSDLGKNIGWGVAATFANIPVLGILLAIAIPFMKYFPPPTHPIGDEIKNNPNLWSLLLIWFMAGVLAPIWEEICFRGLLFPALARVLGSVALGAISSGFLFAAIHPQGIALWLMLGWIGVMGALLTHQTKSLVPAIVMHALHNTCVLLLGLFFA